MKVPAGLLCNGDAVRLVYAPSGESSGHLTFPLAAMCEVSGRSILAALDMLLSEHRVFSAPDGQRLGDILSESRRYQAEVSNALSDRAVLDAYGWTDIPTDCEFLLDYEIDEETWGTKRKPYRYRWPEEVHNEVLARLLDLNQRRYAEEVAAGLHWEKGARGTASKKRTRRQAALPSSNVTLRLD